MSSSLTLVSHLLSLEADANHYAITGSASLILRGLLPRKLGDLDVIATGPAWECFAKHYEPQQVPPYGSWRIVIPSSAGEIEIFNEWLGDPPLTRELIATAEQITVEGITSPMPMVPVAECIRYKEQLGRKKDKEDLACLKQTHPELFG